MATTTVGQGTRLRASEAYVAGLCAMLIATAFFGAVHLVDASVPFPPLGIAQHVVHVIPGRVEDFFIAHLRHLALRLFAVGFVIGTILAGATLALVVARQPKPRWRVSSFAAAAVLGLIALPAYSSQPGGPSFVEYLVIVVIAGALFAGVLWRALDRLERDRVPPPARGFARTRREFLRAAAGAGGLLVVGYGAARLTGGLADPGDRPLPASTARVIVQRAEIPPESAAERAAFTSIRGLTPEITTNADHYVVDEEIINPNVDAAAWRLTVSGNVGSASTLTYDELLAMPAIEQYVTMECISNDVGGNLVSTARWTGVRLRDVLARSGGVGPGTVRVAFYSVSGYSDSLPVAKALDPDTVVAYGMNGDTLPRAHGYPVRIIAPGIYGMKSVKWLARIEAVNDDFQGYWESSSGWSNIAVIKTSGRIDVPPGGTTVRGPTTIAGLAWAGVRGIRTVQVSVDGGNTWQPAVLRRRLALAAWRQWRLPWTPATGQSGRLLVRAVDGDGNLQTAVVASPSPSGASGYDEVDVNVEI